MAQHVGEGEVHGPQGRGTLVALDPALARCGIAVYRSGRLVMATTLSAETQERALEQLSALLALFEPETLAVEVPQDYADSHATHRSLEGLRGMVAHAARQCRRARVKRYTPNAWKANVPKRVCEKRIRLALTPSEQATVLGAKDDTWDAVGVGLFCLGRLRRGCAKPVRPHKTVAGPL